MSKTREERPKLLLGLIGFGAESRHDLAESLRDNPDSGVAWQISPAMEADAWCVQGSFARLQADGTVRVPPALPHERAARLHLAEPDRPLAFCEPVSLALPSSVGRFDLYDRRSVVSMLARFEAQLRLRAAQLSLAAQMAAHVQELHAGLCHLVGRGRLLAVADRRGEVGLAPGVTARELSEALWSFPVLSHGNVPAGFDRAPIPVLMWNYAQRSDRDLLPARYRTRPIYFRRLPRVPPELQREAHRTILRELAHGPAGFEELKQRTGLVDRRLARGLAALYFTGAITTEPARAARGFAGPRDVPGSSLGAGFSNLSAIPRDAGLAVAI